MSEPKNTQDPTSEAAQAGEFTDGTRGALAGRDDDQRRAVGQDNPVEEGSRQGRERYKQSIDKDLASDPAKAV